MSGTKQAKTCRRQCRVLRYPPVSSTDRKADKKPFSGKQSPRTARSITFPVYNSSPPACQSAGFYPAVRFSVRFGKTARRRSRSAGAYLFLTRHASSMIRIKYENIIHRICQKSIQTARKPQNIFCILQDFMLRLPQKNFFQKNDAANHLHNCLNIQKAGTAGYGQTFNERQAAQTPGRRSDTESRA